MTLDIGHCITDKDRTVLCLAGGVNWALRGVHTYAAFAAWRIGYVSFVVRTKLTQVGPGYYWDG